MIEYAELDGVVLEDLTANLNTSVAEVTGLSGMPNILGDTTKRAQGDGVVEPPNQFLDKRVSTWEMSVFGNDPANARANWSVLNRALVKAMRKQKILKWRFVGDTLNLQGNVRVEFMTPPTLAIKKNGARFSFLVGFRHADPANYDQEIVQLATAAPAFVVGGLHWPIHWPLSWSVIGTAAGSVDMTNDGDTDAWPTIAITGPITNPVVTNQALGMSVYFDGLSLASGQTLLIDMNPAHRSATVDGVSVFNTVRQASSDYFPVSAGETERITFTGTDTDDVLTTMTISLQSAFVT